MRWRLMGSSVACLLVVSCGFGDADSGSDKGHAVAPISLGRDGTFYPEPVPTGTMSAQNAYNAMRRQDHRPLRPIPANVTPRFGLLTQSNTRSPANNMHVWAFTSKGCETSGNPTPAPTCIDWTFVRASDGRRLGWATQPLSSGPTFIGMRVHRTAGT